GKAIRDIGGLSRGYQVVRFAPEGAIVNSQWAPAPGISVIEHPDQPRRGGRELGADGSEEAIPLLSSTQRKPMLTFRRPGTPLLPTAARTTPARLYQEPPRMTRSADAGAAAFRSPRKL